MDELLLIKSAQIDNLAKGHSKYKFPLARPRLGKIEREYMLKAFDSGWISSSGEFILRFQEQFAGYIGSKFGIATSNGTVALHLALTAAGIGPGNEVIVPDLTFVSPANMVLLTGAKPVFADSNPDYWGVDVNTIQKRLSRKTKAVIVVHLYGHPVDLDPIVELCESRNLVLIEDCAEAHGALYKGKRIGSFGRISTFSFYGNKLLTTGEGGMCLTNDSALESKMKLLRDHGADKRRHFWHPTAGFNYRMTNLQAAIGCGQLQSLEHRIEKYRKIAAAYRNQIQQTFGERITPHPQMDWAKCVFWMYTLLLNDVNSGTKEKLFSYLEDNGIETRPTFYPLSKLPMYKSKSGIRINPIANYISKRGISLPTYEDLQIEDITKIVDAVWNFIGVLNN